jgi:alanine dehydrogenase
MNSKGTLLLKRSEVAALLVLDECIAAVQSAFKLYAEGRIAPPGVLGIHAQDGGFHIKAGLMDFGERAYFVAKTNANFPGNIEAFGLPLIQGTIVLCDARNGYPLALMDSIEISIVRTGAATAVAAKYLARKDSKVATVCGCGNQGQISLRAIMKVRPLERIYAFDLDYNQAQLFARDISDDLGIEVIAVKDFGEAVRRSDICVTCTPSRQYFIEREMVAPGTFIAAVGADNEGKQELDPMLMVSNKVVVDILEQSATIGDLHHALEKGLITRDDVHAELGEVIAGRKAGRTDENEIIIFDSTGTALQDVVAAVIVYEKAVNAHTAFSFNFAD